MKSVIPVETQLRYGRLALHAPVGKLMAHISCNEFYQIEIRMRKLGEKIILCRKGVMALLCHF